MSVELEIPVPVTPELLLVVMPVELDVVNDPVPSEVVSLDEVGV